jgi:putative ABC transport system permease protein
MRVSALHRKLLRDTGRMKGQILTIALVLAGGITSFIGLRGTYVSLLRSRDVYYDRQRFAHVFAQLERAPESIAGRIETSSAASVQTRISEEVSLPSSMDRPRLGPAALAPSAGEPTTPSTCAAGASGAGSRRRVLLLEAFAGAASQRQVTGSPR